MPHGVLIPLNSGLEFNPRTAEKVADALSLNPFEFRAGIQSATIGDELIQNES